MWESSALGLERPSDRMLRLLLQRQHVPFSVVVPAGLGGSLSAALNALNLVMATGGGVRLCARG